MEQQVKDLKKRSVELAEEGDVDAAHTTTKQAESLEVSSRSVHISTWQTQFLVDTLHDWMQSTYVTCLHVRGQSV